MNSGVNFVVVLIAVAAISVVGLVLVSVVGLALLTASLSLCISDG